MPRGVYPRGPKSSRASSIRMKNLVERRWSEDYERTREISVQNGKTACGHIWQCDTCGRVIVGMSIGSHLKHTGHEGRTRLGHVNDTNKETK